ncbi:MAG: head fiber protein [Faecalicoccus sp.]|uniref:head fiber protein n=1 Tax=Faecalicoccus sp. TaxID=1971758 RepID=UPI002A8247F5|nr:head fiber protein [Faecalicoccus sp.]MCI6379588.1 head fiber protein [Erysipelotrichaceae bacterium]MDY4870479.1 head fiber protein [Faecalicoccus sp.]
MPTTNDNSIVTKGILRYFYNKLKNNIDTLLGKKVDKVDGKGLSTNDFTTAYKNKLDGIAEGANKYTLPTASSSTLGGIKTGYQTSGKVYALQVDRSGNGYVSVPWENTNTEYTLFSTTSDGLAPMLPKEEGENKFLNGNGQWVENTNITTTNLTRVIFDKTGVEKEIGEFQLAGPANKLFIVVGVSMLSQDARLDSVIISEFGHYKKIFICEGDNGNVGFLTVIINVTPDEPGNGVGHIYAQVKSMVNISDIVIIDGFELHGIA